MPARKAKEAPSYEAEQEAKLKAEAEEQKRTQEKHISGAAH